MGIKTKFNPLGGMTGDKGKLSEWRYSTADNGQITLYEYLGNYDATKPVYVPKKGGKTVINNYISGSTTTASNTPFFNNPSVKNVDLQGVPFVSNNMYRAFNNCQNLTSVEGINRDVTNMYYTFYNCFNLNQNIQVPSSVTSIDYAFSNCRSLNQNIQIPYDATSLTGTFLNCSNLNQNIQIPSSVTSMMNTFSYCFNLNQNIQIPSRVTTMINTFAHCFNLNQNIQIPSSVTRMDSTFLGCGNLNQSIQIPSSVTNMATTFVSCTNLNQNIQIPSSVTRMDSTFDGCYNIGSSGDKHIVIHSAGIINTNGAFYYTSAYNMSNQLTVIFPLRYINNVNTVTRNTLVTAATGGYAVGTAVGNTAANTTEYRNLKFYDFVAWEGYNTWYGNGSYWLLNKWAGIGKAAGTTSVVVPNSITSYATYPTTIVNTCFSANKTITSIDCNNTPMFSCVNAFRNCTALTTINNINIPSGITTLYSIFTDATALTTMCGNGHAYEAGHIHLEIPNSVTNAIYLFDRCKGGSYYHIHNGFGITNGVGLMYQVNTRAWNLYLPAPNITNVANFCRNYSSSYRKNIYIYFKYANGVGTKTFNALCSATYMGGTDKTNFANPRYNATSNFYVYNMGVCPV